MIRPLGPGALVLLLCVTNLAAGAGLGVALDRGILLRHGGHRGEGRHGRGGDGHHGRELGHLGERLGLDADQAERVRTILDSRRPLFDEAMRDVRPRLRAIREETEGQIRLVLRPEQAARLDELRREWDQESRRFDTAPTGSDSLRSPPLGGERPRDDR